MKEIKRLTWFFVMAILAWSCNDAIDIEQPGRLGAEQAFQSVADLELGLLGAYGTLDATPQIQFNSVFPDEIAIGFGGGGQGLGDGTFGFILNAGSAAPTANWTGFYDSLNAINRLIEAAPLVELEDGEQQAFNEIVGQALGLRAYINLLLVTYFSTDYTDDSALAGILVTFVPTIDQQLPRNTNGEFFASIESDLDMAQNLITTVSDAQRVSLDFVTFMRIRVAAYRQQYATVETLAAELSSRNPLVNRAGYEDIFRDTSNEGVIFEIQRVTNDAFDQQGTTGQAFAGGWAGANYAFVNGTIDGSPYFEIGRSLFDLMDPADIRFDVNVNDTSIISPDINAAVDFENEDVLVVGKYFGIPAQPLLNDLKIFRAAELVLYRAEAAAAAGNINGAANSTAAFLKELRDARFGTDQPLPMFANATDAFGAILDERRVEFAFEGYRWVDLKRMGARGNRGVSREPLDCAINGACTLPVSDFRFTMPIPVVEFNANPDIIQNPGY